MAVVLPQGALFRGGVEGADPQAPARERPRRGGHRAGAEPLLRHRARGVRARPPPAQAAKRKKGKVLIVDASSAVPQGPRAELPRPDARRSRSSAGCRASRTCRTARASSTLPRSRRRAGRSTSLATCCRRSARTSRRCRRPSRRSRRRSRSAAQAEDNLRRVMHEGGWLS